MPCTAPGVRAIMPTNTDAQQRHSAKAIASAQAASTSSGPVPARKPSTMPKPIVTTQSST